jgi:glyoxylase-like metal-dependent hydrolase (beta-lactamase superfamily II)
MTRASAAADDTTDGADWTDPGAFTVGPGIHRIPLPLPTDGLRSVNVYAVEDEAGLVLVDSGWALEESRTALEQALRQLGYQLGDVRQFLVTHVHRDHYTQALAVRREFGTRVLLGRGEEPGLDILLSGEPPMEAQRAELTASGARPVLERIGRMLDDSRGGSGYEPPDGWFDGRSRVELTNRVLDVVPTPGHTQGHVVLADLEAGVLFAGDHVLPHITPSIGFEPAPGPLPLRDYLQSLAIVRALPDLRLLPAHGPVTASSHERIDALLAHHEARLAEAADAVRSGCATGYDVSCALRWTRKLRRLDELDSFNQMLAVIETRAHLQLLVATGRLTASTIDGVDHYA